ncbi:hypothetical protein EUX98_g2347 [Antrodiella citrinella]|uniref:NADP-dependent oxidoreductase domain-containing protein n=1 Tax=Antrodiella citrinella TaxID=2447956 RepID=A0A4S4MZ77_9APHY|nr:hypothetical protein EUX98_g2347 [Antrodiella citrinella]
MPPQLPVRKIGNDLVSAIGWGAMGISSAYSKPGPDEERLKVIDAVYEQGCTLWDTADAYGDSEDLLGACGDDRFKRTGKRSEIFLASKFGFFPSPDRIINGDPEYTREAIDKSLRRLGVDQIDLYYLHRPDPTVPIELTVGAMSEAVKAGKIRYIGLSECSASTLRRAHAIHPISAVQIEYSPFALDVESEQIGLLKVARELGITIVAYSPLGRGILTGQYKGPEDFEETDFRRALQSYSAENFPNILNLAAELKQIGEKHDATAGQVALAWLLAQGEDIIPIPGTSKVKYLTENLGALKVKLTSDDITAVRKGAEVADKTHGDRYPAQFMKFAYANTPPL